ncbi:MAG: hypothetical protein FWC78_06820 [Defluviitaleaceae bacterium]|nr:hypothetical protein [Defluviitaleaceae bacterium]
MDFSKNQTQFDSAIHGSIWNAGRLIFPLNKSLEGIKDEKTKAACADYYNCTVNGYADMYANLEIYGLHQDEAEQLLQGKNWGKAMVAADIKDDKAKMKQFTLIGKRIDFIKHIHEMIKKYCAVSGKVAKISTDNYNKIVKFFKSHCGYNEEKFLELTKRLSFEITPVNNGYELTNSKYPGMLEAMIIMHETCKNLTKNHKGPNHSSPFLMAERFLDFRVLGDEYECTLEDALYSIDDANKKEVLRLSEILLSLGFEQKCRLNSVDWTYDGKGAVSFNGMKPYMDVGKEGNLKHLIRVHFDRWNNFGKGGEPFGDGGVDIQNKAIMEQVFDAKPNADELKRFCILNLIKCRECGCKNWGPPPHGQCKVLFGKRFRTCGGHTNIGIEHLNKDNFDIIVDLAKAKIETINFNKKLPAK